MLELGREDRLRLLKFVCSFAWTDLQVSAEERALVEELAARHGLDEAERAQVAGWLAVPPAEEEIDPTDIPAAHRQVFYEAVKAMVEADGRVMEGERDSLDLFRELLHDS